jgi:sigma-B regulation protein RsbU (phosphoserine phosphatase)
LATNGLPIAGTCDEPRIVTDRSTPSPTHAASADGEFVYSNAGHNSQALLAPDGIWSLGTGGPILGALLDAEFEQETLRLQRGNTMVMFTDGATEARTARDEEFGEDRLMACLSANAASPPVVLLNRIFTSVREFCQRADQTDDIIVTVTRYG